MRQQMTIHGGRATMVNVDQADMGVSTRARMTTHGDQAATVREKGGLEDMAASAPEKTSMQGHRAVVETDGLVGTVVSSNQKKMLLR